MLRIHIVKRWGEENSTLTFNLGSPISEERHSISNLRSIDLILPPHILKKYGDRIHSTYNLGSSIWMGVNKSQIHFQPSLYCRLNFEAMWEENSILPLVLASIYIEFGTGIRMQQGKQLWPCRNVEEKRSDGNIFGRNLSFEKIS